MKESLTANNDTETPTESENADKNKENSADSTGLGDLTGSADSNRLDMNGTHRVNVLFSGSSIVTVDGAVEEGSAEGECSGVVDVRGREYLYTYVHCASPLPPSTYVFIYVCMYQYHPSRTLDPPPLYTHTHTHTHTYTLPHTHTLRLYICIKPPISMLLYVLNPHTPRRPGHPPCPRLRRLGVRFAYRLWFFPRYIHI
jgi:hypothetical protein